MATDLNTLVSNYSSSVEDWSNSGQLSFSQVTLDKTVRNLQQKLGRQNGIELAKQVSHHKVDGSETFKQAEKLLSINGKNSERGEGAHFNFYRSISTVKESVRDFIEGFVDYMKSGERVLRKTLGNKAEETMPKIMALAA